VKVEKIISNLVIYYVRNKVLQITLWGSKAHQIDEDFNKNTTRLAIAIVTSTVVRTYRGNYLS
jgi:hypothetical protein